MNIFGSKFIYHLMVTMSVMLSIISDNYCPCFLVKRGFDEGYGNSSRVMIDIMLHGNNQSLLPSIMILIYVIVVVLKTI